MVTPPNLLLLLLGVLQKSKNRKMVTSDAKDGKQKRKKRTKEKMATELKEAKEGKKKKNKERVELEGVVA
jgi:hypothetical protein